MGLFNKLFGEKPANSGQQRPDIPWIDMDSLDQLDVLFQTSMKKPQIVYKHSTTCGISSMVLQMFSKSFEIDPKRADFYFLDIHRNRPISNEIAHRTGVRHESPQLIILENGEVKTHTSHGAIVDLDLEKYL